jgi:hypothetical protein
MLSYGKRFRVVKGSLLVGPGSFQYKTHERQKNIIKISGSGHDFVMFSTLAQRTFPPCNRP